MTIRPSPEPRSYKTSPFFTSASFSMASTTCCGVGTNGTSGVLARVAASCARTAPPNPGRSERNNRLCISIGGLWTRIGLQRPLLTVTVRCATFHYHFVRPGEDIIRDFVQRDRAALPFQKRQHFVAPPRAPIGEALELLAGCLGHFGLLPDKLLEC